jgi:hypothetical protein
MSADMTIPNPPAKLLEIKYQGYFMCRIATDPDPTNEGRGMSGYTMALAQESLLDQVIRLQPHDPDHPDYFTRNLRPPLRNGDMGVTLGVKVCDVRFDGQPFARGRDALCGAKVWLDGKSPPMNGPVFNSRNSITGSDDTMAMVVTPFHLRIEHEATGARITAIDHLDPAHPEMPIWKIFDPAVYQRRLTSAVSSTDMDVLEAINVYDTYGYFRDRRRYLEKRIADVKSLRATVDAHDRAHLAALDAELEGYESRIYQLELWGDRVIGKLNMKCAWQFASNGLQTAHGELGGTLDIAQPWQQAFWFGGWDGDLLIGYMRGTLSAPFTPHA